MRTFAILALLALAPATAAHGAEAAGWLAYGDLRGYVEPCGCDPATDMGGIRRIAAVVERERARRPEVGVFVLGNNLPEAGMHPVKAPFLLEADARNRPTATLVNALELAQLEVLASFAKAKPKALADLHLVLSNARSPLLAPGVEARAEVDDGRFLVLGYVWDQGLDKQVARLSPALIKRWADRLAKGKDRHKVLLYAGPPADLEALAGAKIFDTIVASNASPMSKDPGVDERHDELRLRRLAEPAVYAVPLGGQGILRGGSLLFDEAKPLAAYLGSPAECKNALGLPGQSGADCSTSGKKDGKSGNLFKTAKRVSWLDATVGESAAAQAIYVRYDAAAKVAFQNASADRLKDLASSPYVGSAACVTCHKSASDAYKGTQHATAMDTLKAKGKHEDGECVSCHSVGATAKGGFVSLAASPHLANVQCESCHGPRKEHVANPAKAASAGSSQKAMDVCVSCHNSQHSPEFDQVAYWRRISHGF